VPGIAAHRDIPTPKVKTMRPLIFLSLFNALFPPRTGRR
jgi:hypothetical protein